MMYKDRLLELREEAELTQKDIAKVLDIYKGLYNQYEREYAIIPTKHLNTLCNYFDISLDYILGFNKLKRYSNYKKDIDNKISGKRLKELRKDNNVTQDKFAKILKTANTTISGYERGARIIATPFLYEICKKYHISADYLLGKVDEPKNLK